MMKSAGGPSASIGISKQEKKKKMSSGINQNLSHDAEFLVTRV